MHELRLAWIRERVGRAQPWVLTAVLVGLALLAYYASLGVRYWVAREEGIALGRQIATLRLSLGSTTVAEEEALLAQAKLRRQQLVDAFPGADGNALLGTIAAAARDTGISLDTITAGEPTNEAKEGVAFEARSFSLSIRGPVEQMLAFFALLRARIPTAEVGGIQISTSGGEPAARLSVIVLSEPKPMAPEAPVGSPRTKPTPTGDRR